MAFVLQTTRFEIYVVTIVAGKIKMKSLDILISFNLILKSVVIILYYKNKRRV